MKKMSGIRVSAVVALTFAAVMAPVAALADDHPFGEYEVNLGNGVCATVSCSAYGCSTIATYYCQREVLGG